MRSSRKALEVEDVWVDILTRAVAVFDEGRVYRYLLNRRWGRGDSVAFVMLNPSTATASEADPTNRRCITFAMRWGFDAVEMVNLYALRSPDPKALRLFRGDPIGEFNDSFIGDAVGRAAKTVVAWGVHGERGGRGRAVAARISEGRELYCLGTTRSGEPRRPLYVRGDTGLSRWRP